MKGLVKSNAPSRKMDRFLRGLAMLSGLAIAVSAYVDWRTFRIETRKADQIRRILATTEQVLGALKDAETGQRGFLLTGDFRYLEPYNSAQEALPQLLETLSSAAAVKPMQAARVAQVRILIMQKRAEMAQTLNVRRDEGERAALAIVKTNRGQDLMDKVRSLCGEINKSEYADLSEHSRQAQRHADQSRAVTILGSLILFALLVSEKAASRLIKRQDELLQELDEARQRFQMTLVGIGDAVIATDSRGIINFTNPVAQALTGWDQDEAVAKPLDDVFRVVNEITRTPIESPVTKVLRDGAVTSLADHIVLLTKSGNEIPIEDSGAPIRDRAGRTIGVVLVFRNITDRRRAAQDITQWKQIFDNAGFGMAVLNANGERLAAINEAFAAMHGFAVDELVGRPLADLAAPEWRDELLAAMHVRDGDSVHRMFEGTHVRKDGTKFACLIDMTIFLDAEGAELYRAAYFSDISERKKIEEATRESEERFRTLATALPELIWSSLADGTIEYVNPLWREYAGWPADQGAPSDPWANLLHPDEREQYLGKWSSSLNTGDLFEMQCRLRRASDRNYRWFLCRAVPMRDPSGRIVRWLGGCTDIHHQIESADQLKRTNEALRRSNADLEQFAYAASHDLQEPLRMVAIYTQLLKEEYAAKLDLQANSYIDLAVTGARRVETLLKDLLLYSRVSGAQTDDDELVDANDALKKAMLNLEVAISENTAKVTSGVLPKVRIPEPHLVQLFQNLISNALKYRRPEPPTINISAERQGERWQFAVADNGIGIEAQYFTHIFGVFKRLHGHSYEGTGIGLAICQKIVDRNGGRICVQSEPGKGSIFFFTLRAA
jgi:PAS domain S-box-containing protein